jgi:nucleoside-triphosphatase THEP1
MDQPVLMRRPLSALAEAVARLDLAVVEEIGPLAALEYVMEEIRPAVGMSLVLYEVVIVVVSHNTVVMW